MIAGPRAKRSPGSWLPEPGDMPPTAGLPSRSRRAPRWAPEWARNAGLSLLAFGVVAVVLVLVAAGSLQWLAFAGLRPPGPVLHPYPWVDGWFRWDGGWYVSIAQQGYRYAGPHLQSAVAFFPAYPALMRLVGRVTGNVYLAGMMVTFVCGAAALAVFRSWTAARLGKRTAWLAMGLLLVYPFSYYLVGAVYADALFLLAALVAFSLLERGHPIAAGLVGMLATAARPVGTAIVIGLVYRGFELSRQRRQQTAPVGGEEPVPAAPTSRRWSYPAGAALSVGGLAAYCGLLWYRFGEPFAFAKVADAPGWNHHTTMATALTESTMR